MSMEILNRLTELERRAEEMRERLEKLESQREAIAPNKPQTLALKRRG